MFRDFDRGIGREPPKEKPTQFGKPRNIDELKILLPVGTNPFAPPDSAEAFQPYVDRSLLVQSIHREILAHSPVIASMSLYNPLLQGVDAEGRKIKPFPEFLLNVYESVLKKFTILVLVGPSGVGKSTLANELLQYFPPEEVNGRPNLPIFHFTWGAAIEKAKKIGWANANAERGKLSPSDLANIVTLSISEVKSLYKNMAGIPGLCVVHLAAVTENIEEGQLQGVTRGLELIRTLAQLIPQQEHRVSVPNVFVLGINQTSELRHLTMAMREGINALEELIRKGEVAPKSPQAYQILLNILHMFGMEPDEDVELEKLYDDFLFSSGTPTAINNIHKVMDDLAIRAMFRGEIARLGEGENPLDDTEVRTQLRSEFLYLLLDKTLQVPTSNRALIINRPVDRLPIRRHRGAHLEEWSSYIRKYKSAWKRRNNIKK
jgi:hypothetical protein